MCLSASGDNRSEAEWRSLIGTTQHGTGLGDAHTRLVEAGFDVDLMARGNLERLWDSISDSRPMIIGILSGAARGRLVTHAVVVTGIVEDTVIGLDPSFGTERAWEWEELDDLWSFAGARGLVMPPI